MVFPIVNQGLNYMNNIKSILSRRNNVNVVNNNSKNVYDDIVADKINNALDKPKAIGEILAEKLNAPNNKRLYIKLAYQYSTETLFECLALTDEAKKEGRIKTTSAQYFYGIVIRKKKS